MIDGTRTDRYGQGVARAPDPARRAELLRDVVEYLQTHGVNDMSLAPMAEALGTSKRMLLYYFGDRGELLMQALAANRPKVGEIFHDVTTADEFCDAARTLWLGWTRGDQRRSVRLLLQVLSLASTEPETYGAFARFAVEAMIDPISDALVSVGFARRDARLRATLVVSGLRGLVQDRLVTGQDARVDAAAELLIAAAVGDVT